MRELVLIGVILLFSMGLPAQGEACFHCDPDGTCTQTSATDTDHGCRCTNTDERLVPLCISIGGCYQGQCVSSEPPRVSPLSGAAVLEGLVGRETAEALMKLAGEDQLPSTFSATVRIPGDGRIVIRRSRGSDLLALVYDEAGTLISAARNDSCGGAWQSLALTPVSALP